MAKRDQVTEGDLNEAKKLKLFLLNHVSLLVPSSSTGLSNNHPASSVTTEEADGCPQPVENLMHGSSAEDKTPHITQ